MVWWCTQIRPTRAIWSPTSWVVRLAMLTKTRSARYLRITPKRGDGYYSISEFQAYCELPDPWPPKLSYPPRKVGWAAIDNPIMVVIKGVVAGLGVLVLLWTCFWLWRGRPAKHRRTRDAALAALGLVAFMSWWNLGHYHFDHHIHIWEHYHYYIGAKFPELRYSRIYECTAVADMQDGLRSRVKKRTMRALGTHNELGDTSLIIADPGRCTKHFEPWRLRCRELRSLREPQ